MDKKRWALLILLAWLLLLITTGSHAQQLPPAVANANCTLKWSRSQLYVRELTGNNDGLEVEAYLRITGNRKGDSWCGAFCAAGQKSCGLPFPAGAGGSYNWFLLKSAKTYYVRSGVRGQVGWIQLGDKVGFFYSNLGRIGHIGIVVREVKGLLPGRPPRGYIIRAGNTGSGGGRNGAGVHEYFYSAADIYAASRW